MESCWRELGESRCLSPWIPASASWSYQGNREGKQWLLGRWAGRQGKECHLLANQGQQHRHWFRHFVSWMCTCDMNEGINYGGMGVCVLPTGLKSREVNEWMKSWKLCGLVALFCMLDSCEFHRFRSKVTCGVSLKQETLLETCFCPPNNEWVPVRR